MCVMKTYCKRGEQCGWVSLGWRWPAQGCDLHLGMGGEVKSIYLTLVFCSVQGKMS